MSDQLFLDMFSDLVGRGLIKIYPVPIKLIGKETSAVVVVVDGVVVAIRDDSGDGV